MLAGVSGVVGGGFGDVCCFVRGAVIHSLEQGQCFGGRFLKTRSRGGNACGCACGRTRMLQYFTTSRIGLGDSFAFLLVHDDSSKVLLVRSLYYYFIPCHALPRLDSIALAGARDENSSRRSQSARVFLNHKPGVETCGGLHFETRPAPTSTSSSQAWLLSMRLLRHTCSTRVVVLWRAGG